ncbi:uncharacterized protein G2W53_023232 [Senna tora]|uniref:Neprosin PEP catalytic domain-containing protein n=1 Tax=Senna tora TaxID=362788 RepID=A0A834WCQ8_9FABA|nr:uncharacterized protein G2W53_023232 [Senna tora]
MMGMGMGMGGALLVALLILLVLLLHIPSLASSTATLNYTTHHHLSSLRLERIQTHLRKINKPPLLSIQSPDGDVIDCVHKKRQPALDHPLLKGHKIQKAPREMPRGMKMKKEEVDDDDDEIVWQMWHRNGTRCPRGTVAIRRSSVKDVLRAKSLYHFGKKPQPQPHPNNLFNPTSSSLRTDVVSGNGHEHAIAYTATGASSEVYGAKATINVWDPSIQVVNEFSLSQIWILSGSFDGTDLNSIEAGWQVHTYIHTYILLNTFLFSNFMIALDRSVRSFMVTADPDYSLIGRIAIGAAISPVSSFDANQYDITILIWKDPKVGNWWMSFGDNTLVGYWPAELFTHLAEHATMVEWGGEVVNTRPNNQHTSTQMGSGHFPDDGFGKASYFRNLEIVDTDNTLSAVQNIQTLAENTNCYDIKSSYSSDWGTYFYFGGPGRTPLCP